MLLDLSHLNVADASNSSFVLFLILRPRLRSTLFPYTTLFRSCNQRQHWLLHRRPPGHARQSELNSPACVRDRKSTRLNASHVSISYAVFCLKKKIQGEVRDDDRAGVHRLERRVKDMDAFMAEG